MGSMRSAIADAVTHDKAAGDAVREKMFAARPVCGHCNEKIESIEEAKAVYFTGRAAWKLVHLSCVADAILSMIPGFKNMGGRAARSMPGAINGKESQ